MNSADTCKILTRTWWALVLRGVAAITFGIAAGAQPGITLKALIWLFGAFALVDGVLAVVTAVRGRGEADNWLTLLLWGMAGAGIGLLTLIDPGVTAMALLYYIAIWAFVTGVAEIQAAIRLRREIKGELLLVLMGCASIALGVIIAVRPGASALALTWMLGVYSIFFGLLLFGLAVRVRSFMRRNC